MKSSIVRSVAVAAACAAGLSASLTTLPAVAAPADDRGPRFVRHVGHLLRQRPEPLPPFRRGLFLRFRRLLPSHDVLPCVVRRRTVRPPPALRTRPGA